MNKKRLFALPIVAVIVALLGISVMAASPATGVWKVFDRDNIDQSLNFQATPISDPGLDLTTIPGLKADIEAKGLKASDFKFKLGYDVHQDPATYSTYDISYHNSHTVFFTVTLAANEYAIVIHRDAGGYQFNIVTGPCTEVKISGIDNFSPFYVYVGAKTSSPQTGDFAPAYIAMISVALISCGAIFAVRAKKATK